jgi:type IV fimbrial biogenesis protein FimT
VFRKSRGFTLIEMMVAVAIAIILIAIAAPAFNDQIGRRRLEGAANELSADLQYARTQAVSDNRDVSFQTTSTSAYTITSSTGQSYKSVTVPQGVSITSGVTINFLPLRGCTNATCTAADASITVTSSQASGSLRLTTTNMGRVYLCSPSGTFSGYPSCP